MPETELHILLDQNVPFAVAVWLRTQRPAWLVRHVKDLGFEGPSDDFLFRWAQQEKAIVITFDEDFADSRLYPLGRHQAPGMANNHRKDRGSTGSLAASASDRRVDWQPHNY